MRVAAAGCRESRRVSLFRPCPTLVHTVGMAASPGLVDQLADVTGVRDLEQLDLSLVTLLCETLQPVRAAVYATVSDGANQRWYLRASQAPGESLPRSDAFTLRMDGLPLRGEQPLLDQCATSQRFQCERAPDGEGFMSGFPLFEDMGSLGVLQLDTDTPLRQETQRQVGSLLRFYGNFRCLVYDNERDQLTGLLNRKSFDHHFDRALEHPSTGDEATADHRSWLAVFDVDHFKRVNDQYGHLIGDEVLLLVGRLMRNSFRFSDKVFRFGGEEFVLVLRGAGPADALRLLESFRECVASYEFPQVGHLTISIGFTELGSDDTPHAALERADRAVYAAKEGGRNQVCLFEQLVAEGRLEAPDAVGGVDFF